MHIWNLKLFDLVFDLSPEKGNENDKQAHFVDKSRHHYKDHDETDSLFSSDMRP